MFVRSSVLYRMALGVVFSLVIGVPAFAASQASVTIDQISGGSLGTWTLLFEDGSSRTSSEAGVNKKNYSLGLTEFGQATLSLVTPQGMSATISVYRGGDLVEKVDATQYSFALYPNDRVRFLVQYSLARTGSLGITSEPSGVKIRIKGSSGKAYNAISPYTFVNLPAGRYSVTMGATDKCVQPAPQAVVVKPEERNTIRVTLNCEKAKPKSTVSTARPTKRSLVEYVEQRELKARGTRK